MNNIEDLEWAKEVPFLATVSRKNPFTVPEGYFMESANNSMRSARIYNHVQSEHAGYIVPENYFNRLSKRILDKIARLESNPAVGFAVPQDYFIRLQAEIIQKTSAKPAANIVRLKLWQTDLMKYASAACVIFIAGTGFYFNNQNALTNKRTAEISREQMLYDIDESTIIEHIQSENASVSENTDAHGQLEDYILNNYSTNEISRQL